MSKLHYIEASGSAYEAGRLLGCFGAKAVHEYLVKSAAWSEIMAWKGSERVARMQRLVQSAWPSIWQEIEGLSAGLQWPVDEVFLWNCRGDLWAFAPDGCSTVMLPPTKGLLRFCHNEDGDPGFHDQCALVNYCVDNQAPIVSFAYPGSILGHTFAVNGHGLAVTVNNIRQQEVQTGMPRMVLARAVMDAQSQRQAIHVLEDHASAGAFHLAIASTEAAHIASVEYGGWGVSVEYVDKPIMHANHAVHERMRDMPQLLTGSSSFRQQRGMELLAEMGVHVEPLRILGDRQNRRYPIYRQQVDDPDNENTMATADISVSQEGIHWQVLEWAGGDVEFSLQGTQRVS